jgi:hypothetical protein
LIAKLGHPRELLGPASFRGEGCAVRLKHCSNGHDLSGVIVVPACDERATVRFDSDKAVVTEPSEGVADRCPAHAVLRGKGVLDEVSAGSQKTGLDL